METNNGIGSRNVKYNRNSDDDDPDYDPNMDNDDTDDEKTKTQEIIKRRAIEYFALKYSDDKIIAIDPEKKADIEFFKSILPDMAALNPKAKRLFKSSILQLINDILADD